MMAFYNFKKGRNDYDIFIITIGNKYGIINNNGKEIIPCIYDYISNEHTPSYLIVANIIDRVSHYKYGIIDMSGKEILPIEYDCITCENNDGENNKLFRLELNNKYGLADGNGKIICNCIYDDITCIRNNHAVVKLNNKYGLMDILIGKIIIPINYDNMRNYEKSHILIYKNNRWGIIDLHENIIIPCKYDKPFMINKKYNSVIMNHQCGLIDPFGKEILPCKYYAYYVNTGNSDDIIFIYNDMENNKYFTFNNGKIINLKNIFKIVADDDDDNEIYEKSFIYKSSRTKKYGIMSIDGNILAKSIYKWIDADSLSENNIYIAYNGKKYCYIDKLGHRLTPFKYSNCDEFECDTATIANDDKNIYIIDNLGNETICNCDKFNYEEDDEDDDDYDDEDDDDLKIYYNKDYSVVFVKTDDWSGYLEDAIKIVKTKYFSPFTLDKYYDIMNILIQYVNPSLSVKLFQ